MRHLKYFKLFQESNSYKTSVNLARDDNYHVDYTFEDDLGNHFFVQFKNITSNGKLTKEYTFSYFVWDQDIENWSVTKEVGSNPFRIVRTVLGDVLNDFIKRKLWCSRIHFEGLSSEQERDYISRRSKMYLRFLEQNPLIGWSWVNYGNKFILSRKLN